MSDRRVTPRTFREQFAARVKEARETAGLLTALASQGGGTYADKMSDGTPVFTFTCEGRNFDAGRAFESRRCPPKWPDNAHYKPDGFQWSGFFCGFG